MSADPNPPNPPPSSADATDLTQSIRDIIKQMLVKGGLSRIIFNKLSTYSSGNPTVILPGESAAPGDARTQKILQPWGIFTSKPVTGDTALIVEDEDQNRVIVGKIVDQASAVYDANALCGLYPVEPGTTTTHASANTQESTNSSSYVKLKEFKLYRPGRYRVTFGLSKDAGTANAILRIREADGTTYTDASTTASSAGTFPTFNSNTLDMNVSLNWGQWLSVWVLNTLGPTDTSYINNAVVKSQPATAAITPDDRVILD